MRRGRLAAVSLCITVVLGSVGNASAKVDKPCSVGCTQRAESGIAVTLDANAQNAGVGLPAFQQPPVGSTYLVLTVTLRNTTKQSQDVALTGLLFSVKDASGNKFTAANAFAISGLTPGTDSLAEQVQALSPGSNKLLAAKQSVHGSLWYKVPSADTAFWLIYWPNPLQSKLRWLVNPVRTP